MGNSRTTKVGQSRWISTLIDAGDGSGDLILSLPDELMEEAGWKVGDVLKFKVDGDKCHVNKKE